MSVLFVLVFNMLNALYIYIGDIVFQLTLCLQILVTVVFSFLVASPNFGDTLCLLLYKEMSVASY